MLRVANVKRHSSAKLEGPLCRPLHRAEQRARQRVGRTLVDRLRDHVHAEGAAEDGLYLLGREAVRPLVSWLEVAKALQKEAAAGLEQANDRSDILRSPLGRQDVEAAAVEDQIERP